MATCMVSKVKVRYPVKTPLSWPIRIRSEALTYLVENLPECATFRSSFDGDVCESSWFMVRYPNVVLYQNISQERIKEFLRSLVFIWISTTMQRCKELLFAGLRNTSKSSLPLATLHDQPPLPRTSQYLFDQGKKADDGGPYPGNLPIWITTEMPLRNKLPNQVALSPAVFKSSLCKKG